MRFLKEFILLFILFSMATPASGFNSNISKSELGRRLRAGKKLFYQPISPIVYECSAIVFESEQYRYSIQSFDDTTVALDRLDEVPNNVLILTPIDFNRCRPLSKKEFMDEMPRHQCLLDKYQDFLKAKKAFLEQLNHEEEKDLYHVSALLKKQRSEIIASVTKAYNSVMGSDEPQKCVWSVDMFVTKRNYWHDVFITHEEFTTKDSNEVNHFILSELNQ